MKFLNCMELLFLLVVASVLAGGMFALIYSAIRSDIRQQAKERAQIAYCYDRGLVNVTTEAGIRCVDPKSLIAPKLFN